MKMLSYEISHKIIEFHLRYIHHKLWILVTQHLI